MLQNQALEIMQMGYSVYLTGSAGSGKTYTLNQFIAWARQHCVSVAVTASTGIAATHINGQTIHSWSGIGIKDELTHSDITKLKKRKDIFRRITKTKVLIIDEISMIDAGLLDNVNKICQAIRESDAPFGGLQVILTGDLFQLPPVSRSSLKLKFAVESEAWKQLGPVICYLSGQHRQLDADPLLGILDAIRGGKATDDHLEILKTRFASHHQNNFEDATRLHSHNQDVDSYNQLNLNKVDGQEKTFVAIKTGPEGLTTVLAKSCLAPEHLKLKIGAEVMFVKNNQQGKYVNGTRGQVINFSTSGWPVVKTLGDKIIIVEPEAWQIEDDSGQPLASLHQVPLRLAWAITVHKSQGMSLDSAVIDLSQVFEYGMGYVALSRVRSLEGLVLTGLSLNALNVDPKILKFDVKLKDASALASARLQKLGVKKIEQKIEENIIQKEGVLSPEEAKIIQDAAKLKGKKAKVPTHTITKNLLVAKKMSITEAAAERSITEGTIISHIQKILNEDAKIKSKLKHLAPKPADVKLVKNYKKLLKDAKLGPIKYQLESEGIKLDFDYIRLCLAFS